MELKDIGINMRNWVDSAQDRDYWRALVMAALNFRVPKSMQLINYLLESDLLNVLNLAFHVRIYDELQRFSKFMM